nr:HlyD family efflux transporter periplasmic adaptor subunit [Proteiniborus sp. DW1]
MGKRWSNVSRGTKKKRIKRKRFRITLIIIVVSYIFSRMIPVFSIGIHKTVIAEAGVIEDIVSSKGIVIKDEFVYKSETQGTVSLLKQEGEKVAKGVQVARINRAEGSTYSNELEEINRQIEILKKSSDNKEILNEDKNKIHDNIASIIDELQNSILSGNYSDALIHRDTLLMTIDKQQLVAGQNSLMSNSLDNLLERKNEIIKNMESSKHVSYAPKSGIISYQLDGLEDIFTISKINDYESSDYRLIDVNKTDLTEKNIVNFGEPVYKIIDNFTWYIMTEVDSKGMDKLEEGKTIYIKINDDERKIISRVVRLVKENDKCFIILKLTEYFHEYYNERYLDIHIVKNTYEGLIIPSKSIIEKDGIKGVYIKDISGIVKFRPIKILASHNEHTIVSKGAGLNSVIELEINGEVQKFNTMQMYDEVFVNGSKIKEGLIID